MQHHCGAMMTRHPALSSQIRVSGRRGLVIVVMLGLIGTMMAFGTWFFLTTVQSKNVFQVFFRDDAARIIAESALAEWRATFQSKRLQTAEMRNLFQDPKLHTAGVPIKLEELPLTREVGDSLVGGGQWSLQGKVTMHHVDDQLMDTVAGVMKRGTFGKEYQGTLRVEWVVGFEAVGRTGTAQVHFLFDFDTKLACLRSRPADRIGRGYTASALNDYVLYVRDGKNEFQLLPSWCVRTLNRTLTIGHSQPTTKGKIFLGGATSADMEQTGKFLFEDPSERLQSTPPSPPLIGRTGPIAFTRFLPFATSHLRSFVFSSSTEFLNSSFCQDKNVLLNGIYVIRDPGGLVMPHGWTYSGKGVIISFGDIRLEGSFTKRSRNEGPCMLYTWVGNIHANAVQAGRIEASLIALRFDYDDTNPSGPRGSVNFSQRPADVLGSLVVDALDLQSMAPSATNLIRFDSTALVGDELYVVTIGGQIRRLSVVYQGKDA